ncbi:MAG: hypothetical protein E7137_06390 [Rikenellaceae bacterium]|nr:hypothetical protein [Rikenellaceae bacterium]
MIRISCPKIERHNDRVLMISNITDEYQNINEDIYYTTTDEYGEYLCHEVADAFVVGVLLPAARYEQDIIVEGAVSDRLYYNINNSVLYTLSFVWRKKRVRLYAKEVVNSQFNGDAVGCGCSLGIDSFAAMLLHLNNVELPKYNITHLTYFNVGAMGYANLEKAKASYNKDIELVKKFATKVNLPIVQLESNFSILYKEFDFDQSGDIRNFSAVLALQKLFGKYLYGSSYPIQDFKFEISQTGYYETLLAPLLSTNSCEIVIANPDLTRIEKTKIILDNKMAQQTLYVCWKELLANKFPNSEIARIKDKFLNCSRCDKCLRTLLAIDVMGCLEKFKDIFDIEYYKTVKDKYVAKVIYANKHNAFYKDLSNLIKEYNHPISFRSRIYLVMYRLKVYGIAQRLKSLLKK